MIKKTVRRFTPIVNLPRVTLIHFFFEIFNQGKTPSALCCSSVVPWENVNVFGS